MAHCNDIQCLATKRNGEKVREIPAYEILDFSIIIVKASIAPVSRASLIKVTAF
jgi:hypothetical protein